MLPAYRTLGKEVAMAEISCSPRGCKRPDFAAPPLLKRLAEAGHHGRKSGRGFYDYAG